MTEFEQLSPSTARLTIRRDQALIAIPTLAPEGDAVTYFTDDASADEGTAPDSLQRALSVIGALRDIDAPDALTFLDRIRHQSEPTPPIEHL